MSADEFDIIAKHFAPLATSAGARGLIDDAAVLETQGRIVVTTDTIVEGVHFLSDDPIESIAKKALRVNLSDIAAKGAAPIGVLLALAWPKARASADIALFAEGLREDLARYDAPLLGGDTASTPGPLTVTVTIIGKPLVERVPSRADAKTGDDVWVTGAIGDAWLGLQARLGTLEHLDADAAARVTTLYQLPAPPTAFAPVVAKIARASMDVSDGLLGDAGKIAAASKVAVHIEAARVPLSRDAQAWIAKAGAARRLDLLSGGDDYQILFTADPAARAEIEASAAALGVTVTRIGAAQAGEGVQLIGEDGAAIAFGSGAHRHRLGR